MLIVATFSLTTRRPSSTVSESTIVLDSKGEMTSAGPTTTTVTSGARVPSDVLMLGLATLGTVLILAAGFYPRVKNIGFSGGDPNIELNPQLADAIDRRLQELPLDQRPSFAQIAAALNLGALLASLQVPLLEDSTSPAGQPVSEGAAPGTNNAFWDGVAQTAVAKIQQQK